MVGDDSPSRQDKGGRKEDDENPSHPLIDGRFAGDSTRARIEHRDEEQAEEALETHSNWEEEKLRAAGAHVAADEKGSEEEDEEEEPPWILEKLGQLGIYIAILGAVLSVIGVSAAWLGIQPLGNISMTFSLGLITLAMVLGAMFQAYVSDFSPVPG